MYIYIDIHHLFIIHPSSVLSRCHFRKGRTAQQHMLGNGIQPDLPRIHMAYADGWLAPCGLKGNDDDDEKDDKDSASISSALVDILWRVLLFLFTTKYLSAIYHDSIQFLSILSALEIKEHANAVYHMFFRLYGGKRSRKKTLGNPTGRSSFGCRVHSIWQRQTSSPLSQYGNGAMRVFLGIFFYGCSDMTLPQATTSLLSHCWETSISVYLNPLNLRWPISLFRNKKLRRWIVRITDRTHTCSYMCVSSILDVPPVPEIPGLDDFTVYLIMAGSVAHVDQIVCVHRLLADWTTFHKSFWDFSRIFTIGLCKFHQNFMLNLKFAPHLVVKTNGTLWRHGDLHVVRVDFGHLPGLRRVGQHCAHSSERFGKCTIYIYIYMIYGCIKNHLK